MTRGSVYRVLTARRLALCVACIFIGRAFAQAPASQAAPLPARQQAVQERVQRLENRMLELSRLLEEKDPGKAERLRDGLSSLGKAQVRARFETLVKLLEQARLGEAEQSQTEILAELQSLLSLLNSNKSDIDAQREERRRLEALKRQVRKLMDEQLEHLYRAQHVEQQIEPEGGATPQAALDALRQLEKAQRETQSKAEQLQRDMRKGESPDRPTPGAEQMQQAGKAMREAADRFGEAQPERGLEEQQKALEGLQQALDELEDSLRQVRREETEETLAALETRLKAMLQIEGQVRDAIAELAKKPARDWTRADEQANTEALGKQTEAAEECEATLRILVDEGTTVIVPELLRGVSSEMQDVREKLDRKDAGESTSAAVKRIIGALEELLAVAEQKREADAQAQPPDPNQQQAADQAQPLLPKSAELKLLRAAQARLNERTASLAQAPDKAAEAQAIAAQQAELMRLASRMNERD